MEKYRNPRLIEGGSVSHTTKTSKNILKSPNSSDSRQEIGGNSNVEIKPLMINIYYENLTNRLNT